MTLLDELKSARAMFQALVVSNAAGDDKWIAADMAARLRKRIEHVKRLEAKLQNPSYVDVTQVELDLFATLTGPLP